VNRLLARLGVHRREHVSVARDFSIYSAVNILSLVLLFSTNLWLRRFVGPYVAGLWTALELLPGYATYAHLGIINAAERELPFLLGAGRTRDFDGLKDTLFWATHALGAALATLTVTGALLFRGRLSHDTFVGLLVYAPCVWAQMVATYFVLLYRARKRFVELSRRQGVANLAKALLLVSAGMVFGFYGILIAELATYAVLVVVLGRGLRETFARVFESARLPALLAGGLPILAGGLAFETLRPGGASGADQTVILATLGRAPLGVYSIASIVCQGLYYLPNALSIVMYPRFQERYGQTQSAESLRRFVEVQLHVLADVLLAAIAVLFVALPAAIRAFFPDDWAGAIAPLRVMLVATYFISLAPPGGQLLLTIRKQMQVLLLALPCTALGFAAAYVGARYGLVGVAAGIALACFVEFVGVNAYALAHFSGAPAVAAEIGRLCATAAAFLGAAAAVERLVPVGPWPLSTVGGWPLVIVAALGIPLLLRALHRVQALQAVGSRPPLGR
jgi:O-antigen/teichoic acid export membrane protein